MFRKWERCKVFRDPIHTYIRVEDPLILDLIDSKEVQRLRRIRQLSGVSMVFQTAEHSRFTHALGAYEVARLVLEQVEGIEVLTEYEQMVLKCAALLHDIGHGPYSHAFEQVLKISHEEMTCRMILSPKTQVHRILHRYEPSLAEDIASVIAHQGKFPLIESLVSSQLDVDRMDYLTRDAYFTGATYGTIDIPRILRSMKIIDGKLVYRASGVHTIESYLMSRYHMYYQVYFHPVARAYELLLESIYKRIYDLSEQKVPLNASISSFMNVISNQEDVMSYIDLDDAYVNGFIKQLTHSEDEILCKLANSFENRKLFSYVDLANHPDPVWLDSLKKKYAESDGARYFYYEITVSQAAYLEMNGEENLKIKILLPNGEIRQLNEYSAIVNNFTELGYKKLSRVYYFDESEI